MPIVTATEFNQRPSEIKAMSECEPVFVTDRGHTTTVVLSLAEFDRLRGLSSSRSLSDALVADDDLDFEVVRDRSIASVPDLGD